MDISPAPDNLPTYIEKMEELAQTALSIPGGIKIETKTIYSAKQMRQRFYQAKKDLLKSWPKAKCGLTQVDTRIEEEKSGFIWHLYAKGTIGENFTIKSYRTSEEVSLKKLSSAPELNESARWLEVEAIIVELDKKIAKPALLHDEFKRHTPGYKALNASRNAALLEQAEKAWAEGYRAEPLPELVIPQRHIVPEEDPDQGGIFEIRPKVEEKPAPEELPYFEDLPEPGPEVLEAFYQELLVSETNIPEVFRNEKSRKLYAVEPETRDSFKYFEEYLRTKAKRHYYAGIVPKAGLVLESGE